MNVEEGVEEERSKGAGSQESQEEEEDGEEVDGADSHSDLDSSAESVAGGTEPAEGQCPAPGGGPKGDTGKACKASSSELPYTFEGRWTGCLGFRSLPLQCPGCSPYPRFLPPSMLPVRYGDRVPHEMVTSPLSGRVLPWFWSL